VPQHRFPVGLQPHIEFEAIAPVLQCPVEGCNRIFAKSPDAARTAMSKQ
jgi:hypothetical protein